MSFSLVKTLKLYQPVLIFLLKFAGFYFLLSFIYNRYLSFYQQQTDPLTYFTGKSVEFLFHFSSLNVSTEPLLGEEGLKLLVNDVYLARIIEGCNAVSVIIMFVAFLMAFGYSYKNSFYFAPVGTLLIYFFNIIRIGFLAYILYEFPEYQDIAHRVVFPGLIYGFVVFLWIIFIKKFNNAIR